MKYKYLIYLPIMFYLFRYFAYKINLKLVFRSDQNKIKYDKNNYENFIRKFYKMSVKINKLKIRSEGEYLDAIYIKNIKKTDYITIYL